MNVLFLTLLSFDSISERNIYTDLLREFAKNGHKVYAISPIEKRFKQTTYLMKEDNALILRLQIGNTQKTNIIEKGISTIMIEPTFKKAIKKYFSDVRFDLVLYSTPPITLVSAVSYVKKRDNAKTYLLLKDIFPQNAVDIGMMSKTGLKSLIYHYFRKQEEKLYSISDFIGCMSQANVNYLISHNQSIKPDVVDLCPNSIDIIDRSVDSNTRKLIRIKYGIPDDKIVFVYGGNLGKPQGIPFLIKCVKECGSIKEAFFLIVGDGTEYHLLQEFVDNESQDNVKLLKSLPKEDYDTMIGACDIGLIFLDHRFTIPNFPSRLLAYMQAKLPIVSSTDPNTDIGKVIVDGGFGWWCESDDVGEFVNLIKQAIASDIVKLGENGFSYLVNHYSVEASVNTILKRLK